MILERTRDGNCLCCLSLPSYSLMMLFIMIMKMGRKKFEGLRSLNRFKNALFFKTFSRKNKFWVFLSDGKKRNLNCKFVFLLFSIYFTMFLGGND